MIVTKSKFYTQILFANTTQKGDWHRAVVYDSYKGDLDKVPFYFYIHNTPHSAVTDLTESMDDILKKMNKHMQKDIRKAKEAGCVFEYGYFYDEFIPFYRSFASKKGIDSYVSMELLQRWGKPIVTKVSLDGVVLAMHVRALDLENKIALGLYSSNARFNEGVDAQIAGRANKYLQYKDLELLKEMGIKTYDWSGVDVNPSNKDRFSIGEYKLAYGCEVIPCPSLYSPLYRLMFLLRKPYTYLRKLVVRK